MRYRLLLTLCIAAAAALYAEGTLQSYESAKNHGLANSNPGCIVHGHFPVYANAYGGNTNVLMSSSAANADTPQECADRCKSWFQNAKYRGLQLTMSGKPTAYLRHREYYCEWGGAHDFDECYAQQFTGDTEKFWRIKTNYLRATPCYSAVCYKYVSDYEGDISREKFDSSCLASSSSPGVRSASVSGVSEIFPTITTNGASICKWSYNNQNYVSTGYHLPCLSWQFKKTDSGNTCTLYNDVLNLQGSWTGAPANSNQLYLSGNLYCQKDGNDIELARDFAKLLYQDGCMRAGQNFPNSDIVTRSGIANPHDCRRECQKHDDCVIFSWVKSNKLCYLKTWGGFAARYADSNVYSGARDCPSCFPGYYIQSSTATVDSCQPCEVGYYCSNGNKNACPANSYCVEDTLSASGQGFCAEATRAGVACQHRVCRDSVLGSRLRSIAFQEPGSFDFSLYSPFEQGDLSAFPHVSDASTSSLQVTFPSVIDPSIVSGYTVTSETATGVVMSTIEVANPDHGCVASQQQVTVTDLAVTTAVPVNSNFKVCVANKWIINSDDNLPMVPSTWLDPSQPSVKYMSASAKVCQETTLSYMSAVRFTVSNIYRSVPVQGITITYTTEGSSVLRTTVTDAAGIARIEFEDSARSSSSETSSITIVSAKTGAYATDIEVCTTIDEATGACSASSAISSGVHITTRYYEVTDVSLVDTGSRSVTGVIGFPHLDVVSSGICALQGVPYEVLVQVGGSWTTVISTTTGAGGSFGANIPVGASVKLELKDMDHVIEGVGADAQDLVSSSLLVQDDISGLVIHDVTSRTLTLHTAATRCNFSLGSVGVDLTFAYCPGMTVHFETSAVDTEYTVPATALAVDLTFAETNVQDNFYFQFADSTINLHDGDQVFDMTYEPIPVVLTEIPSGEAFDANTVVAACGGTPFAHVLEGSQYVDFVIKTEQTYNDQACGLMPSDIEIVVTNGLAPTVEAASCNEASPCSLSAKDIAANASEVVTSLLVGEPTRPLDRATASHSVEEFIRSVVIELRLPSHWNASDSSIASARFKTVDCLVIGKVVLNEGAIGTFPGQDPIPLYYLYAPPVSRASIGGSYASASFTGSFSVESSMYVKVTDEDGATSSYKVSAGMNLGGGSANIATGGTTSTTSANVTALDDVVNTTTTSTTFELKTKIGSTGKKGDMVLFMGSVANLTEATILSFLQTSCTVGSAESLGWGQKSASLVYQTRADCERSLRITERSIESLAANLDSLDSEDVQMQLSDALVQRDQWLSLLKHWDDDFRGSLNFPLNNWDTGSDATNIVTFGAGGFSFSETTTSSSRSVTDFYSTTSSESMKELVEASLKGGFKLFSVGISSEISSSDEISVQREVQVTLSETETDQVETSVSTVYGATDVGDTITVAMYRSPYSGAHVYRVLGGTTQCPHVPGTLAREAFTLLVAKAPADKLDTDTGSFSFYIDTRAASLDSSDATFAVKISVDSQSATGGIVYSAGGQVLSSGLTIDVEAGVQHPVQVFYERLDTSILSTTVVITVESSCDSGVSASESFTLNWVQSCAPLAWAGDLTLDTDSWELSTASPTLLLERASGSDDVARTVSVWASTYVDGTIAGTAVQIGSIAPGHTQLELSSDDVSGVLVDGQRYVLELRAACDATGSVRSSRRLGVYDVSGPKLTSIIPVSQIRASNTNFAVANLRFNEMVDCSASGLSVTLTEPKSNITIDAALSCSSWLYDASVVLMNVAAADVTTWSASTVELRIRGVTDLFGNVGEIISTGNRRRLANEDDAFQLTIPEVPATLAGEDYKWQLPDADEVSSYIADARDRMLPSSQAIPSTFTTADANVNGSGNGNGESDSDIAAIVAPTVLAVIAAVVAAVVIIRRRRNCRHDSSRSSGRTSQYSAVEAKHVGDSVVAANPVYDSA